MLMTLEKEFEVCIKFELLEKKRKFYQKVVMMGSVPKTYILGVLVTKNVINKEILVHLLTVRSRNIGTRG